jgi:hypothetical protein
VTTPQAEQLTHDIHVPLWPSLRQQIDDLARSEAVKPATKARQLILAGLAAQQSSKEIEVKYG